MPMFALMVSPSITRTACLSCCTSPSGWFVHMINGRGRAFTLSSRRAGVPATQRLRVWAVVLPESWERSRRGGLFAHNWFRTILSMTIRLAHISDLHVPVKRPGWGMRDLFTKRATGWINVRLLGRGRRFRHARQVVQVLRRTLVERALGC